VTRPTPNEDTVRSALKDERDELAGESSGSDGGTEAAVGPVAPAEPDAPEATEPEPEDELTVALRERDEYLNLAKRTQADFENYRKRAA
jgi:molecular chaperone GrpE